MSTSSFRWKMLIACWLLAIVAPLAGRWWRENDDPRCDWDGVELRADTRVAFVREQGTTEWFCSLRCAERWLSASQTRPLRILVTDESTGEWLEWDQAVFVRSGATSAAGSRERRHAFGTQESARRHVADYGGRILDDMERPFGHR